ESSSAGLAVQPPHAADDVYTVWHGQTLNVVPGSETVLLNDVSPAGNPLTAHLTSAVSHGTLALSAAGSFTYKPAVGFIGTDSFTYRAGDGFGDSEPATVTISVIDAAPDAVVDEYTVHAGEDLNVFWWDGVLGNDNDAEDD